jgi:hypothetical protein
MRPLILSFIFCLGFFAGRSQDSIHYTQKINNGDTTWPYTINDADIILKVQVNTHVYETFQGLYTCTVVKVIKGKFGAKKIDFDLGMIESNMERYEKRFRALDNYHVPFEVYIGLLENKNGYPEIEDKSTGEKYEFFMSAKDLRAKK